MGSLENARGRAALLTGPLPERDEAGARIFLAGNARLLIRGESDPIPTWDVSAGNADRGARSTLLFLQRECRPRLIIVG